MSLYRYTSTIKPAVNMTRSLSGASAEEERRLAVEEQALDQEPEEYAQLLKLID
jgi:hypothetical protein